MSIYVFICNLEVLSQCYLYLVLRTEEVEIYDSLGFQVVDLQVFAIPRITLKPLVPNFPCFAKIFVSLMEKVQ